MPNIQSIPADVTTVNNGAAIALNKTPLLGGQGREAKYSIPVLPLTSTVKLQGAPATASGGVPAANDPNWADLLTITSASAQVGELADLPEFIRYSTTVLDADGPVVTIYLEGVQ